MTRSSRGGRKKERDLDRCVCMKRCNFFWRGVFNLWVLQRQRPHHGRSTTLLLLLPSQATAVPTKTFPHTTACRRPDACIMMQIALITHFSWCVWCVCVCLWTCGCVCLSRRTVTADKWAQKQKKKKTNVEKTRNENGKNEFKKKNWLAGSRGSERSKVTQIHTNFCLFKREKWIKRHGQEGEEVEEEEEGRAGGSFSVSSTSENRTTNRII